MQIIVRNADYVKEYVKQTALKVIRWKLILPHALDASTVLMVCPTSGMSYQGRWKNNTSILPIVNEGRRTVLKTSMIPVLGLLVPEIRKDSSAEISHRDF